jgi:hypothetical protein
MGHPYKRSSIICSLRQVYEQIKTTRYAIHVACKGYEKNLGSESLRRDMDLGRIILKFTMN